MATRPSAAFSINGGAVGAKASVAAGATVVATLDDISGVAPVTWSIANVDDTSATTDYALVPSGSVNQVCTTTALTAGKAAELKCTVNGGQDPITQTADVELMSSSVKFYVPTTAGREVFVAGEVEDDNRLGSATHGIIEGLNTAIRSERKAAVTITSADLTVGGVGPEAEVVLAVPANGRIVGYDINLTDAFDNGAGVSLTVTLGTSADVDSILSNFDAYTGSANEGLPGGGSLGRRFSGDYGGSTVNAYFTAGADQLANFTNGSLTIELYYVVMP